jgi:hypothetical protein
LVIYPGEAVGNPGDLVGGYVVMNFDAHWSEPIAEGDPTTTSKIEMSGPGPVGSHLLWLDTPTLGTAVQ